MSEKKKKTNVLNKRTKGREIALQYLYLVEILGKKKAPTPETFLQQFCGFSFSEEGWVEDRGEIEPLPQEIHNFATQLIQGCLKKWEDFSTRMESVVQNFRFERVFPIDRAILRIALFEIIELKEIPLKVSINEAIELGKKYSTAKSGGFINGVLEKLKDIQ